MCTFSPHVLRLGNTVTLISPYNMYFSVGMLLMFMGFAHLACKGVMGKTCRVTDCVTSSLHRSPDLFWNALKIPSLLQLYAPGASLFLPNSSLLCPPEFCTCWVLTQPMRLKFRAIYSMSNWSEELAFNYSNNIKMLICMSSVISQNARLIG